MSPQVGAAAAAFTAGRGAFMVGAADGAGVGSLVGDAAGDGTDGGGSLSRAADAGGATLAAGPALALEVVAGASATSIFEQAVRAAAAAGKSMRIKPTEWVTVRDDSNLSGRRATSSGEGALDGTAQRELDPQLRLGLDSARRRSGSPWRER